MKLLRIYVDTSVIGGCFDKEFAEWSIALMEDFRDRRFQCVVSDVTAAEVAMAPDTIQDLFEELLSRSERLEVTRSALELLSAYESHAILGPRFRNDMLHIAIATVGEVDVVVSWNFMHIVRLDKIRLFNAVSLELGYRTLSIYSPREVATHGREE
jgi:hypothetical protein